MSGSPEPPNEQKGGESNSNELDSPPEFAPEFPKPRSLYLHVPFCRHRCGYCNFSLVAGRDHLVERYLDAIAIEIGAIDQTYELDTIFLGGGTPSHLTARQLKRLGSIIASRFKLANDAEVTAECNPNDLNEPKAGALAKFGVNRISLGVQSLNPSKLKQLERDHSPVDVERAVSIAHSFCQSVSLDLIFAAPNEGLNDWRSDLSEALALNPDHVSTYELTFEKGTQFWNRLSKGQLSESGEELRAEMYVHTIETLAANGLEQYEVSSFSKSGHQCRHNLAYWKGDPYFAFGPGASRFIGGVRSTNHQSTMNYLKRIESGQTPIADQEKLEGLSAAKERLAIGLRMTEGVMEDDFQRRTGFSVAEILSDFSKQLQENKMLIKNQNNWRLTRKGILICDWISSQIVDG